MGLFSNIDKQIRESYPSKCNTTQQLQTSKNPHELEAFNVATTTAERNLQRTAHYIIQKGVYSKPYLWVQNYDKGEKTGHTLELSKHM